MKEIIIDTIRSSNDRCISYAEFMELALYHPTYGYYKQEKTKIGKSGDFYTSSSISPVFAEVVAIRLIKLMEEGKLPPIVLEFGGGNGTFAKQFLTTWKQKSPRTFKDSHYIIMESSPFHTELIEQALMGFENISFFKSFDELKACYPAFNGIIFSNEFFDAFPIHIIQKKNDCIEEIVITESKGELVEKYLPLSNNHYIFSFLKDYKVEINENQRYEIPLSMITFFTNVGRWMEAGIIVTIDYGYTDEEWGLAYHRQGSLRGYFKHQLIDNPLERIGEMDLTSHIHFDKLIETGKRLGYTNYKLIRQDDFLIESGILEHLKDHTSTDPFSEISKKNRAIRSLIMQGGISTSFRVLIQSNKLEINL